MNVRRSNLCLCRHGANRHAYSVREMPCRAPYCRCREFRVQLALPFPTEERG